MAGALAVLSRLVCSIWRWWRSTSTAPALGLGRGSTEKSIGAPGPLHAARSGRLGMQGYLFFFLIKALRQALLIKDSYIIG
jgi:hypothetical protein